MTTLLYAGRALTVLLTICIFIVALAPREVQPVGEGLSDKAEHLVAFFVLAVLYSRTWGLNGWQLVVSLTLYGVMIEVAQSFTPCRQASILDVVADIAGILLGFMLIELWQRVAAFGELDGLR